MSQADPSKVISPLILPRPVTGYRRQVQIAHSFAGVINLLTTEAAWDESINPNYVVYAATPPKGPKQPTLHSRGVEEIGWRVGGEVTSSTMGLLNLLDSNARGVNLSHLYINQGSGDLYSFANLNGYSLPWSSFTVSGNPGGAVAFTLEGRSARRPDFFGAPVGAAFPDVPVPSWYSGNEYVVSWSLTHSVNLIPKWRNNPSPLPAYYRPGESRYTIQVSTSVALREHTLIRFGTGFVSLVESVVTSRNRVLGDSSSPARYETTSANARVSDQRALFPSTEIQLRGGPIAAGYS